MSVVLHISCGGQCSLKRLEPHEYLECLRVPELGQTNEITSHTCRHKWAHLNPVAKKDVHFVSHALMDIQVDPSCKISLNPFRQHVLDWSPYFEQYDSTRDHIVKANNFRGPILITKELSIPLPKNPKKSFTLDEEDIACILNHDSKPETVDMTEADVKLLLKDVKPIYRHTPCTIL